VLRKNFALAMALAVAASLMLAGGALAHGKDRNHDRIPDRWEKRHHLSLHKKQGRRDQDHDGLKNRGEWKARLDPRDADTDNDGTDDGDENTGKVESFANGVLTISLFNGDTLSGAVTDETEIECDSEPGDDRGEDEHGDDDGEHGDDEDEGEDDGDDARAAGHGDEQDEDEPGEDDDHCSSDALTEGTVVHEAELSITGGGAIWEEIELITG
jgi:hypothetical protein